MHRHGVYLVTSDEIKIEEEKNCQVRNNPTTIDLVTSNTPANRNRRHTNLETSSNFSSHNTDLLILADLLMDSKVQNFLTY